MIFGDAQKKQKKGRCEMTIDKMFDDFIEYCKSNQLSNRTIDEYTRIFYKFVQEMDIDDIEEIDKRLLLQYQNNMIKRGLMNNTINSNTTVICIFLKWMKENGYIFTLPTVKPLKVTSKRQPMFTEAEVMKLITFKSEYKKNFVNYRNYISCYIMANTGCRVSSMLELKVEDLDINNGLLTFKKMKNQKPHTIPIDWELQEELQKYIKVCNFTNSDYIICSAYGNKMDRSSLGLALKKYAKNKGIEFNGHHSFRRYFITKKVKDGIDMFALAKYVGHSNSKMIEQIYYQYSVDHMRSVVLKNKNNVRKKITL